MKLEILKTLKSTENSITIFFKQDEGLKHKPGQHGNFVFDIGGKQYKRSYSFHTLPDLDEHPGITIRTVEGGSVSPYIIRNEVHSITLDNIAGDFFIEPSPDIKRHLIMFAGGSGITPLLSMIKAVLHREIRSTISLIYSNQTHDRIIFRDELQDLESAFGDRFKVYHVLTREEHPPSNFPVFFKGRLSKLIIKKILKPIISENNFSIEYYLCGPFDFTHLAEESIRSLHTGGVKIFKEHFFIPNSESSFDFSNLLSQTVVLRTSDDEKTVMVEGGKSILQAGLDSNIKLPHSCTEGQCGTCRAKLISGQVKLRKNHVLTDEELKAGEILLCQGFPMSEGVIIQTRL